MDVLIIEQLNELSLLGQENAYNAIIVEFLNIFKRILKDTETRNIQNTAMPNALQSLAARHPLSLKTIREDLLIKVQKLFCSLGKDITTPETRVSSSCLFNCLRVLGFFLSFNSRHGLPSSCPCRTWKFT